VKTKGNTILITGGATGIGLALAEVLLKEGNEIIVCGRRDSKLLEAKSKFPEVHIRKCNLADAEERKALFWWTMENFPGVNVLINNAGIQRQIDFKKGIEELEEGEDEIETNLRAPVHLTALFIPHLVKQPESAIINVSSGLGFIPIAILPVYCATKAAIHSFTWSLRHQLRETNIKVFELIPPTVDTELDKGARARRGQTDRGIQPQEVAQKALEFLAKDVYEGAVGRAEFLRMAARTEPEKTFLNMNTH
jgi:uncharacterized oxidoreductase